MKKPGQLISITETVRLSTTYADLNFLLYKNYAVFHLNKIFLLAN